MSVDDDTRNLSVLEVVSLDRPGLLARIGEVFVEYGVMLQAAKIQTLGERVEDVFFITDTQRQPIAIRPRRSASRRRSATNSTSGGRLK
jgi:UTP:GlnB (protein PII) uridylyltransferase